MHYARTLLLVALLLLAGCAERSASTHSTPRPLPTATTEPSPTRTPRIVFLDVGQGDSALIQFANGQTMLIDGGETDQGAGLVARLRQLGVRQLDWVVASHAHSDHIGGLIQVLRELPVKEVWDSGFRHDSPVYLDYLRAVRSARAPDGGRRKFRVVKHGERLSVGTDATVEVLAPSQPYLTDTRSDPNNNSIVLRITFGSVRVLFTGDMEREQRNRLYRERADLRAEILKVAHHGAHNGTDSEFLRRVQPKVAVISCGLNNRYGHPHRETLQALRGAGVKLYRTDLHGEVQITLSGAQLQVATTRRPPDAAEAHSPTERTRLIGNRNTKVYHAPDCNRLPRPENRVLFNSRQQAESAGYRAHAQCLGE
ncbi:MAG: MBL fold metallo-hydrolase [Fimbriimonadales bacterium]